MYESSYPQSEDLLKLGTNTYAAHSTIQERGSPHSMADFPSMVANGPGCAWRGDLPWGQGKSETWEGLQLRVKPILLPPPGESLLAPLKHAQEPDPTGGLAFERTRNATYWPQFFLRAITTRLVSLLPPLKRPLIRQAVPGEVRQQQDNSTHRIGVTKGSWGEAGIIPDDRSLTCCTLIDIMHR
jgi:hypothetical protein